MSVMTVNFYATLRDLVGSRSLEVDVQPGSTAEELIRLVISQHPDLEEVLLDEGGSFHSYLKMFINGREVVYLEGQFQTALNPADTVDIFPPVGGG